MAGVLFVTWDGGGNVAVALGIAGILVERGHVVTMLGPASLRRLIEERGIGYAELGVSPPLDSPSRSEYLVEVVGSTGLAAGLRAFVEQFDPRAVVIDCNLSWALAASIAAPVGVLVHAALGLYLPVWQPVVAAANRRRLAEGLEPFEPATAAWSSRDALIVTSIRDFDRAPIPMPNNVSYVGRVKSSRRTDALTTIASDGSDLPLVIVSYSTDPLQNSPERLQVALDGLANLPVRVLATTSGTFEPERLSAPANVTVFDDMAHEEVLGEAQVVVAHAGHGTTLAAVCHGVPIVCVPGVGRDQIPIARRVGELGLGVALASQSSAGEIRSAVTAVLSDPSYRRRAGEFMRRCGDPDGARVAADIVEARLISR